MKHPNIINPPGGESVETKMASDCCSGVSVSPVENLTTATIGNFVVEVNGDSSFLQINGDTIPTSLSLATVASIEQTVIVVGACLQILHNC